MPGEHYKPGDSIAAVIDVLAAVDTNLIDATFATTSRGKAVSQCSVSCFINRYYVKLSDRSRDFDHFLRQL